jgi:hypothetical protein
MFVETYNKSLFYNEFKDFQTNQKKLDDIWNKSEIKQYMYLLDKIKTNMRKQYFLQEYEWKFYLKQLNFFHKILTHMKIDESYKRILLHNLRIEFNYLY